MLEAHLQGVPFFSGLSKRELARVAQSADEIDVKEGEALAREGEFGQEFFVIGDGTAEVTRGGAQLATLGPGDFFGEMSLLGDDKRMATVTAASPMQVFVMTRASFRALDRDLPEVHARVVEAIEARRAAAQTS
jgi:CRP/FNR family cyclic AMP-dependent transcriptional regulator